MIDSEKIKSLKKDIEYLNEQELKIFSFPNGCTILGIDITNMPSEQEKLERMLKDTMKRICEIIYDR